jgi:hypothetical protein
MRGSFYTNRIAGISDRVIAPVTPIIWSLKSQPKLKSAFSWRGPSKAPARVGRDRRLPFAPNEPELNREGPGAGGTQKSTTASLHGPAWVSRTDFFSGAVCFKQSNEFKQIKKPNRFNDRRAVRAHDRAICFLEPRGAVEKSVRIEAGTGALGARTFSRVCEIFFSARCLGAQNICREIQGGG